MDRRTCSNRTHNVDKIKLTEIFNRGFRVGANARASNGLPLSGESQPPAKMPTVPTEYGLPLEQNAWTVGYSMGYKMGASDAELASVTEPGAHGMIAGLGEQMLEPVMHFQ